MVPSAIVVLESFPLNPNGKIDRKALPAPEAGASQAYVAPRNEVEATLAEIWAQVLRQERVGVEDNFFELGGDSIQSIKIVARAGQRGLKLSVRQLFDHQIIAELAREIHLSEDAGAEQGAVSGVVPLTPIQRWFFELDLAQPHHFNQSFLFQPRQRLEAALLRQALEDVVAHHDALRLYYQRAADGWEQHHALPGAQIALEEIDLSALDEGAQATEVASAADRLQGSFVLEHAPLVRVGVFDLGVRGQRLLMVIHHLVIDLVSWRIVLEDLQHAYEHRSRGEPIALPAKTHSFKAWSEGLSAYGFSAELQAEQTYWLNQPWVSARRLPRDANASAPMVAAFSELDEEQTQALLQSVPPVYRTQINDVLVTALARAFHEQLGLHQLLVGLEGHGREEIGPGVDVSRTVGWFTSVFPVLLPAGDEDPGAALKAVKERLRAIPNRGLGYGVLRYLAEDSAEQPLASLPEPEIWFNYLGRLDGELTDTPWLATAREYQGRSHGDRNRPLHAIDINGGISDGRLRLVWSYDASVFPV
jgi:aryl carrier-like protein